MFNNITVKCYDKSKWSNLVGKCVQLDMSVLPRIRVLGEGKVAEEKFICCCTN